jgi:hypothetical protein
MLLHLKQQRDISSLVRSKSTGTTVLGRQASSPYFAEGQRLALGTRLLLTKTMSNGISSLQVPGIL